MSLDYESLVTFLPGSYLLLSPELRVLAASDVYLADTQSQRHELLGQYFAELFPDNLDEASATEIDHLIYSLNLVLREQNPDKLSIRKYALLGRQTPDDENTFWLVLHTPVFDKNRELVCIIHSVRDYSEDHRFKEFRIEKASLKNIANHEAELLEMKNALGGLQQELDTFAYSISHDFRSPLLTVESFAQALYDEYHFVFDENGLAYLSLIQSELRQLRQLTEDLISFARVRTVELHPEQINLSRMVEEILENLKLHHPQREVEIQIEPDVFCCGDSALMQMALEKLLDNAWKFSRKAPAAKISFGTLRNDGVTEYFVRDNGAGFDMVHSQNLFGTFQRLHDRREFEGAGVGLAIVQRIIHRHNGTIRAEAAPQQGASFYFQLKENCG